MNSPIKAILFDCDGTLVDSEDAHIAGWQHALQRRGARLTEEQRLYLTGKGGPFIADFLAHAIHRPAESSALLAEKQAYYHALVAQGLPPIPHTVAFLRRLANTSLKLALASAAEKSEILSHLTRLNILDRFDVILSGQSDLTDYSDPEGVNKPKPYIYLHAAKLLRVAPSECIVIEDSLTGVLAGKAAGCFTIAVPNQVTIHQDLSAADLTLHTFADLTVDQLIERVSLKRAERPIH